MRNGIVILINSAKIHEDLLYVCTDSVIVRCQTFDELLCVKPLNELLHIRPCKVDRKSMKVKKLSSDPHST